MRSFEHPNMTDFECPVCQTSADYPVVLIPIPGTEDGNIVEARQVHAECYKLMCKMKGIDHNIEDSIST